MLEPIRIEYRRYRVLIEQALEQVADRDLDRLPAGDEVGNTIAVVVAHLTGNLKSRFTDFLTSDGEKTWRQRDREFESPNLDREALLQGWREAWRIVDAALAEVKALGDGALTRTVVIRGVEHTVAEALLRSVAHTSYHAGQIALMARAFVGKDFRSLSIPKGRSADYTANPDREKGPPTDR